MARVPNDYDLNFLKKCSKEELEPLVGILLGTKDDGSIDETGRISSELEQTDAFQEHYPDHTKYVNEIIEEVQKYGAHGIVTPFRGYGVSYHELLCDVAKKLKVNFDKRQGVRIIEKHLLEKVLTEAWEKMPDKDRKKLIKQASKRFNFSPAMGAPLLIALLRAGGRRAFFTVWFLVESIAMGVLGRYLGWRGMMIFSTKIYPTIIGPWGWIISGLWLGVDLLGPAYSVTIPACIYIAALRKLKAMAKYANEELDDEQSAVKAKKKLPAPKKNVQKNNVKKADSKVKAAAKSPKKKNTSSFRS